MKVSKKINFRRIEKKWQSRWEKTKAFQPKIDSRKKKYYTLEMYPYPSASGLHMGHAFNYIIADIQARFKRMQGFNVLYPIGYDSFGLPAENAAIKEKSHPKIFTDKAIKNFIRQQKMLGLSYNWSCVLKSHDPKYYKWNQYFFLQFYKNGLAYRKKANVNWCPTCNTVLANEQVHNGKCWRHINTEVEIKQLEQWFINTTKYADELITKVEDLNWPERIKLMQKNWIGRSEGAEINFKINNKEWKIFTTRPDTLFGVTFLVISAQHPGLMDLVTKDRKKELENFIKRIKSTKQENLDKLDKEGVFTGTYAIHPTTNQKIPVWAGNFVLADYGSGMIMAVPAHDQRDFEFAKKYNLPIKLVIQPKEGKIDEENIQEAYEGTGKLVNSEAFNDLLSEEAKEHIIKALEFKTLGRKTLQYKLRDWLVSRQRYWGTPIPIIYCEKCGIVPVPEKDLPVKLPDKVKFGEGNPLETNKKFINTTCPQCNKKARRETDTMDTFFDSSWYYLRYIDNKNEKEPFNKKKIEYWMPVNFYTGGAEHACMHLIYARFFTKALRDLGFLKIDEPFTRLFNQGMLHKDGFVMSKSRGNVVVPEEVSGKYGIDTARLFLMSIASPDKDTEWNSTGIEGSLRFIMRIVKYFNTVKKERSTQKVQHKINKTIQKVTEEIENIKYNLAIIRLRGLLETLEDETEIDKKDLESFIKLLSPICPHISEELWHNLGHKPMVSLESWPKADESKISNELEKQEEILEKTIEDIKNILNLVRQKQNKEAQKIYIYTIPNELKLYNTNYISKKIGKEVRIFAANDKNKYDPENKAQKTKPNKPGIYIE